MSEKNPSMSMADQMIEAFAAQVASIVLTRVEPKLVEICRREWNEYLKIVDESYQPLRHRLNSLEVRIREHEESEGSLNTKELHGRLSDIHQDVGDLVDAVERQKNVLREMGEAIERGDDYDNDEFTNRVKDIAEDIFERQIHSELEDFADSVQITFSKKEV